MMERPPEIKIQTILLLWPGHNGGRRTLLCMRNDNNNIFRVATKTKIRPEVHEQYAEMVIINNISAFIHFFYMVRTERWAEQKKNREQKMRNISMIFSASLFHFRGVWWRRALCLHSAIHFCFSASVVRYVAASVGLLFHLVLISFFLA